MRVDVLVTTYNAEPFISKTLDSLIDQTYNDYTILINDDFSSDRTVEIIKQYANAFPGKISLEVNTKNLGATRNAQRVLDRTTSDLILGCGHDDLFFKNKIERCVTEFVSNPKTTVIYHDCLVEGAGNKAFLYSQTHTPRKGDARNYLTYGCFSTACAVGLHGPLAREIGFRNVGNGSDWLLFYEVAKKGQIHFVDEVLGSYRRGDTNITKSQKGKSDYSSLKSNMHIIEHYHDDLFPALINLQWALLKLIWGDKKLLLFYIFSPILTILWLLFIKVGKRRIE